ncbi:MAG: nickel-dependent hydrogenase large subunit [Desulfobacterales bacterium]
MKRKKINIYPLNRVEGDLEVRIEIENNRVSGAWSAGMMYRGFENLLIGRAILDGLVLTPRICGICSTSHLKAAAKALDMFFKVKIPDNAMRVRNITLIAEKIQNDVRHAFMLFMADFTNQAHQKHALFDEAARRYQPLTGETTVATVRETKRILEIIAILGGQWPHSSFMVPGGVVCVPSANDLTQCLFLIRNFRKWYEKRVLGCRIERWMEVTSKADLEVWLEESESHAHGELGFYLRFAKEAGLEKIGKGCGNFISFGSLDLPDDTGVKRAAKNRQFLRSGFFHQLELKPFDQKKITEDVSHSWFEAGDGGKHPFDGQTRPYASGKESGKYSWAKAPRYDAMPAETGPLAEMVVASAPLFIDFIKRDGPNVFVRELARLIRPAYLIPLMEQWLEETVRCHEEFYQDHRKKENGQGYGLLEAPRGALGHWVKIKDAKIQKYQIITPTAWNASPRDANGFRGPCEEAIVGTEIKDLDNPIEVDHIIRSFDPCLVCTVHAVNIEN